MLQFIFTLCKKNIPAAPVEVVKSIEISYWYNDLGSDKLYKEYGHTVNKNKNFYFDKNKILPSLKSCLFCSEYMMIPELNTNPDVEDKYVFPSIQL